MPFGMMTKFLSIALFVIVVTGQNHFIFPFPQLAQSEPTIEGSFAIGSTINIQWETTISSTNLVIWQSGPNPLQGLPRSAGLPSTTAHYSWTIDLSGNDLNPSFDLNEGAFFFFGLFQTGATSPYAQSQSINITAPAVASSTSPSSSSSRTSSASSTFSTSITSTLSSTSSPPTSSSSPTSSPSSTFSTSITSTLSSTSSPPTSPNSPTSSPLASTSTTAAASSGGGLSITAKTGLGVGIGVGVVALAAGLAVGYFLYGRKNAVVAETRSVSEQPQGWVDHKPMSVVPISPLLHEAPAYTHSTQQGVGAHVYEL